MAKRAWAGGATTWLRAASRTMYVGFPSSNGERGGRRVMEAGGTKLAVNDATRKLVLDLLAGIIGRQRAEGSYLGMAAEQEKGEG